MRRHKRDVLFVLFPYNVGLLQICVQCLEELDVDTEGNHKHCTRLDQARTSVVLL